ncbi:MAG: hypothetical protein HGA61_00760 [Candidatus Moranbacteria bacterium]|nr:hypothetical protein [Candidatus Moranbacteria bacterium]
MELLQNEVFKALGYLFIAGLVYFAWNTARKETIKSGHKEILVKGFCWCAGIAIFASFTLGQPTCTDYEQDNRGSTCYDYADDGYTPTTEQRVAKFAYFMTLFFIPVVLGTLDGKKEKEIADYAKQS